MLRSDALAARDDDTRGCVNDDARPSKSLELTHARDVDGRDTWDDYAYARTLLGGMIDIGFMPEDVLGGDKDEDIQRRALRVQIIGATTQCEWQSRKSFIILAEYFKCDVEIAFIGKDLIEKGEDVVYSRDVERYVARLIAHRGVGPRLSDESGYGKYRADFIVAFNAGLEVYPEWKGTIEDILRVHFDAVRLRNQRSIISTRADGTARNQSTPPLLITDFNEEAARRASLFLKHVYALVCADDDVEPRFIEPYVNRFRNSQARAYDPECVLPSYANAFVFGFIGLDT